MLEYTTTQSFFGTGMEDVRNYLGLGRRGEGGCGLCGANLKCLLVKKKKKKKTEEEEKKIRKKK